MGGKSKTTSTNQQQQYSSNNQDSRNEIGFAQAPTWDELEAYKAYTPQADPTIPYRAAAQRSRAMSAYANPTGLYGGGVGGGSELGMQRQMSQLGEIEQTAGQEARQGAYDVNQQRMRQLGEIAQMRAPVSYNARTYTSGSGQNQGYGSGASTTQGPGFFSQLGSQVAAGVGRLVGGAKIPGIS